MATGQSEQAAVAYHDELTKAILEIERLNKHCRDLDAKLFKTVAECRTLIDAAQAERNDEIAELKNRLRGINQSAGNFESVIAAQRVVLEATSDWFDRFRSSIDAPWSADVDRAIKEVLK